MSIGSIDPLPDGESVFRTLADTVPLIIWVVDPEGAVRFTNRACCEFFGTTLQALRAGGWGPLVHPDDAPAYVASLLASLHQRRPFAAEARVRRADGAWRWIRAEAAPRFSAAGEFLGMVGSSRDITDSKQAEEALAAVRDQLLADLAGMRRLNEISARLVHQGDLEALLEEILDAAIEVTRADFGNVQMLDGASGALRIVAQRGFPQEFLDFFGEVHDGAAACGAAMQSRRRVVVEDVAADPMFRGTRAREVMLAAGALAVQSTPLVSRTGTLLGMLSTHYRTPRRPVERELHLLDLLARQAADLIERYLVERALRESDRRKDEFLAMLGHELRNPLGVIVSALSVLDRIGSEAPDAVRVRALLRRQTEHLTRLLDDLLDVARITQGRIELRREPLDLRAVIDLAFQSEAAAFAARGQHVALSLPAAPVTVNGDPVRLRQVVGNILNNAGKYTPPGGAIVLGLRAEAGEAILRVEDSGIGIPADRLASIFDLFTRVQTHGTEPGLGIGLALVKRLVELHGGRIEAASDGTGRGAVFVVRLPLVAEIGAGVAAPPPAAAPLAPRRILLVEDNDDARRMLRVALELAGHRVEEAGSGEAAVARAVEVQPDAAVVDIGLPDVDGYEVARRLREKLGAGVRLVALTGYGQPEDQRRALAAGFDAHVVKPVDPEELGRILAA